MIYHEGIPIWEVDLFIIGSITIDSPISFDIRKELEHNEPFYSKIKIRNNQNGFKITLTAFANNSDLAEKAAVLFISRMLDVLVLKLNIPISLNIDGNYFVSRKIQNSVRRKVDKNIFNDAFKEYRKLHLTDHKTYLRALSWFRKAKCTQDPIDKFLAFWNSIETVSNKYNPYRENCSGRGTICHIWECFKKVWGDCENWEFINGNSNWIDECNEIRRNIAHGIIPIEIQEIEKIINKINEVENVSHKFLSDWRNELLNTQNLSYELQSRLD
ncbi:methylamine utilization protein MauJ [Aureivirga marina]|uniref:methylamine utilization protein MauJ n=1 Tax=Aureivirga marina TaxID=1182451 RepID=UPI0018CA02DB|nr:methylamine utilization protein MauJ [Aureivirga marina]